MNEKTIYHERVVEHYRHSKYRRKLEGPTFTSGVHNPSCGDSVCMEGCIEQGRLVACAFQSEGCVISTAAASMLCEYAQGKSVEHLAGCTAQTMLDLIQLPLGPTRMRCALLSLEALQQGIAKEK